MAELRVMGALREKRSELSGVVSRLEQQRAQHRGSLAHLARPCGCSTPACFRRMIKRTEGDGVVSGRVCQAA